jgi:NADP-dependent 3-hydroxy acid dehydrogenase YdfG
MKPIALITGASSGFGEAIARNLAGNGYNLIITGRRKARLEHVAYELTAIGAEVLVLEMDVRDREHVQRLAFDLPVGWRTINVLVNNAGLALGRAAVDEADELDWDGMIDTNVKGLLNVTRAFIPYMKHHAQRDIVNIGSIAGKEVYAGGSVYCASKHAVDALTKAMRIEFLKYNIRVTQIAPGAANTEFSLVRYKGDTAAAESVYQGFLPLLANDIAEALYFAISRPAHVCINDMVIMPTAQANSTTIYKTLP